MTWASRCAAIVLVAAILPGVGACDKFASHPQRRPEWILRARIVFLTDDLQSVRPALSPADLRMMFPFIAGDLYGSPTTGDFLHPAISADRHFEIDLNQHQDVLLASLEPTEFSLPYLQIEPAEARIARLAPMALQANGIEQVGRADWIDLRARTRLLLVYVDRAAWIFGRAVGKGRVVRYDLRVGSSGYFWIARQSDPAEDVYRIVAKPDDLAVAITPDSPDGPGDANARRREVSGPPKAPSPARTDTPDR